MTTHHDSIIRLLVYTTYNGTDYEIQIADMDGDNRYTIYTLSDEPQGLAVDTATDKYVLHVQI